MVETSTGHFQHVGGHRNWIKAVQAGFDRMKKGINFILCYRISKPAFAGKAFKNCPACRLVAFVNIRTHKNTFRRRTLAIFKKALVVHPCAHILPHGPDKLKAARREFPALDRP